MPRSSFSYFPLGETLITEDAIAAIKRIPTDLILRHALLDFGRVSAAIAARNRRALKGGGQITSMFAIDPTDEHTKLLHVITTADRSKTYVCCEHEITELKL